MKCEKCGRELSENLNFCPDCGSPVAKDCKSKESSLLSDNKNVSFNKGVFIGSVIVAGILTIVIFALFFSENAMMLISSILTGLFLAFVAKHLVGGSYGVLASIVTFIIACSLYSSFLEGILIKNSLILGLLFGMGPIWLVVSVLLYTIAMDRERKM